jgi:3-phosphoshikimate 1-carboxyvinyltransferase
MYRAAEPDAGPGNGPDGRWRAPAASGPVRALVAVPGSKSMTNRALILAALADGPTLITGPLAARDTRLMADALRVLGSLIEDAPAPPPGAAPPPAASPPPPASSPPATSSSAGAPTPAAWQVTPGQRAGRVIVDVGNAGTVMRFVPPVAALASADVEFLGDRRASQRPVGELLAALREFGARISDDGRGAIPFTVHGRGTVPGGSVTLDASRSSQLVSGLLLAAPRYQKGAEIRHEGSRVPSAPHIAMTVQMLRDSGADVETGSRAGDGGQPAASVPDIWRVHPGPLRPSAIAVEPDLSAAAPFLAAALVTGGSVTIRDWPARTTQPARQILAILAAMGAANRLTGDGMQVTGTGQIHGIAADLGDIGELVPVLTALAALADSPSVFTGVGHLRTHESDRLAALAAEIGALGGDVTERGDGLEIRPRPLRAAGTPFDSHDDHRLVMTAAVLGLAVPGLAVQNAATVGKTFPAFTATWSAMLEQSP